MMRQLCGLASILLLTVTPGYGQVQNVSASEAPFFYSTAKETTLTGTVATLSTRALPGILPGAHFTLTTPVGAIDVSLGAFAFSGKGALSLTQGQQVEVTGVFKTWRGNQVLVARLVRVGDSVYAIRNIHGLPVPPKAHEHANQEAQNGETR